ncbi:MAG: AsmA family protein [Candidatus Binatia bacterium]
MMRKVLVAVAILTVVLVAVGAFALSNLEGWLNENREWISDRAEESLGRPLSFDEVGVSLGLGLGVRVSGLRIADDPAYADGDLVAVEEARVGVRVLPALRGRFEITHITLVRPDVRIVKTSDGLNFAALGPTSEESADEAASSTAALVALANIEDGRITFTDRTVDPPWVMSAEHVTCRVSDLGVDSPVRFELEAAVLGADSANVSVSGTLGPINTSTPALTPLQVDAAADGLTVGELLRLYATVLGAGQGAAGFEADGSVDGSISAAGTAEALTIEARIDATGVHLTVPGSFEKSAGVPLKIDFDGTRTPASIGVKRASVALHNARVDAHGTIEVLETGIGYNLQLTAEPFDLDGWKKLLPSLSDFDVSGKMASSVSIVGEPGSTAGTLPALDGTLTLTEIGVDSADLPEIEGLTATVFLRDGGATLPQTHMRVGGSTLTAQATIDDLMAPSVTFKLDSPSLDLTAMGLSDSGREGEARREEPAAHDTLREVRVEGSYDSKTPALDATLLSAVGTLAGAGYTDLRARVRLDKGRYLFNPIEMNAFGGRLTGEGFYAPAQGERPEFNLEAKATGVNVGELVASRVVGGQLMLDGVLDGKISLAGSGTEWEKIRDALVGGARLELTGGRVLDVNIAESLLQQLTGVPGMSGLLSPRVRERHPKLFTTGDTVFEDMEAQFSIADGRMSSRDLTLHAEDFSLHGRANVGLDRSLDMSANFEASEKLTATLVAEVDAMKYLKGSSGRVQIPFKLRGFLPDVRPEPDMAFVRKALQRALIRGLTDSLLRPKKKDPARAGTP